MSSITLPSSLKKMIDNYKFKPLSKKDALMNVDKLKKDLGLENFKTDEQRLKRILKKVGSLSETSIKTRNEERNN
ncbi:MAG: hypothetical protein ACPKPY_11270 [Nitrososphaeraceae archaeon]